MNKNKIKTIGLRLVAIIMVGLFCGGVWVLNNDFTVDEPTDGAITEQFFESYAELSDEGEPENMLIVVSDNYPNTYGAIDVVEGPNQTYFMMYGSSEAMEMAFAQLQEDGLVSVERNIKMQLMDYNSWGVTKMGLDDAISAIGFGGESVKVAVIDTGLDVGLFRENYPDRSLETYDVETDSSNVEDMFDHKGHGTHIAGTITEGTSSNVSIYALRATRGESDELYSSDVVTALYKVANSGAKVLNMSFGAYERDASQELALQTAVSRGVVAVAAAGNDATSDVLYPAGYDYTLSVSAVNPNLSFASYSNYGQTIDFAAPGSGILSINGTKSGTSMATPHVVAAVAALKSYNTGLSLEDTKDLLRQHVKDLGDVGWDQRFGYGMIDFSDVDFCDGTYCDGFGVFAMEAPTYVRMEIDKVTLTDLNYYSISNLMLTEVKLYTDETNYVTKKLQDAYDLTISGYDAEALGTQMVTISCDGVSATVNVTNPEEYEEGWGYVSDNNGDLMLTSYTDLKDVEFWNESVTRVYVPKVIDGKNVVKLAATERTYTSDDNTYSYVKPTFYDSTYASRNIKEVYLPDTVTRIDDEVFMDFLSLEKVVMEADGVSVGDSAFKNARRLKTIDGAILEMGESVFSGDKNLKAVTLAEGMTTIPRYAFSNCSSLEQVTVPSMVTTIGFSAFSNSGLKDVQIPDSVLAIEGEAFLGCNGLASVIIPKQASVGVGAFAKGMDDDYIVSDVILGVYSGSLAYDYAVDGGYRYETMDASYARVVDAFDYGDALSDDTVVEMYHDYGMRENETFTNHTGLDGRKEERTVSQLTGAEYVGEVEYFRIGDTYFNATYKDILNKNASIAVNITVNGVMPKYTVPQGLTGKLRDSLNTVELPVGFSWMDGNISMGELGEHTYLARYTPGDAVVYAPIENIEITVDVVPSAGIDDRTKGVADVEVMEDGIMVTAEKACTVIVSYDEGETYEKVAATKVAGEENTRKFEFEITNDVEVMIVLKGDLDMKGSINAKDSAWLEYYLLRSGNSNHRDLNAIERLIADVNDSGTVTARDAALVDYALLTTANPYHKDLEW